MACDRSALLPVRLPSQRLPCITAWSPIPGEVTPARSPAPPLVAARLPDPFPQPGSLELFRLPDLHIPRFVPQLRRRIKPVAIEKHDIGRNVVGRNLDTPAPPGRAVIGLAPLDCVTGILQLTTDLLVQCLEDGVHGRPGIRYPVFDELMIFLGRRWLFRGKRLMSFHGGSP